MRVKKILVMLVVLCMVISLSACGESNTESTEAVNEENAAESDTTETLTQADDLTDGAKAGTDEEVHNVAINLISDEAKEKAKTFPDVSGELPEWRGVNVVDKAEFAWSWAPTVSSPELVRDTADTVYKEAEAIEISEAGYNFVRLCLDSRYFFTEEELVDLEHVGDDFYGDIDVANLTQYENLDEMIEWCIDRDIHVCLDCHSTAGGLMIGGDEEASREELFTTDSEAQKIFVRFWENLAERYADVDTKALSFNLYNEPPAFASGKEEVYVALLNQAIDAIQSYTPDRLIFVDMMNYSVSGMEKIDELNANNLVAGFHFYADGSTDVGNTSLDMESCLAEISTRLADYEAYSREKNVRWMLQEYGCTVSISESDQEQYDGAIIEQCKEYGVPYALWSYNGGDFGVATWVDDSDVYMTPDAEYVSTSQGHRINRALAELTSK